MNRVEKQKAAYIADRRPGGRDEISGGLVHTPDPEYSVRWHVVPLERARGVVLHLVVDLIAWCDAVDLSIADFETVPAAEKHGAHIAHVVAAAATKALKKKLDCQDVINAMETALSAIPD